MSSPSHILSVLVPDRKGIIHTIVDTLKNLDVQHHEISQTVVHGTFTIALVVSVPAGGSVDSLQDELVNALGEQAHVSVLEFVDATASEVDRYILTAIGKSDSGSIRALTDVIQQRGGNFTDFSSRVVADQVRLVAEVELPTDVDLTQLQTDLKHTTADGSLEVRLQHQKLFTATNEVAFRRRSHA